MHYLASYSRLEMHSSVSESLSISTALFNFDAWLCSSNPYLQFVVEIFSKWLVYSLQGPSLFHSSILLHWTCSLRRMPVSWGMSCSSSLESRSNGLKDPLIVEVLLSALFGEYLNPHVKIKCFLFCIFMNQKSKNFYKKLLSTRNEILTLGHLWKFIIWIPLIFCWFQYHIAMTSQWMNSCILHSYC